jgi:hypothetical protein
MEEYPESNPSDKVKVIRKELVKGIVYYFDIFKFVYTNLKLFDNQIG